MGECLILRRTGELYELPVLNKNYPADVTVVAAASGNATFKVQIDTVGKPDKYTYQWYVNGSAVSGATSSSYKKSIAIKAGTYTVHCVVTNKAGDVYSRYATLTVKDPMPIYTYDGTHNLVEEDAYNWSLYLKTKGTLNFSHFGAGEGNIDIFLVGGGGGGGTNFGNGGGAGGGGGGETTNGTKTITLDTPYKITVGGGGSSDGKGGDTIAFGLTADGGSAGTTSAGGAGGSGGGGGGGNDKASGAGGKNGNNGEAGDDGDHSGGKGQGTTTYEFGDSTRTLYAGGGGGCGRYGSSAGAGGSGGGGKGATACGYQSTSSGTAGSTNKGGGGGGGNGDHTGNSTTKYGGKGGSGIVVIRNHR